MRKTKIVCTLGLVSNTAKIIEEMMDAGMDVARFNFSHGDHESHKKTLEIVKRLRQKKNIPVATLLDTKGPEIRLGLFKDGAAELVAGEDFILHTEPIEGTKKGASVSFAQLDQDVAPGVTILLDDGLIELNVKSVQDGKITCKIINGGKISNRKGINLPGVRISMPYISEQDASDIIFGVQEGFDFIAASFARSAEDIQELRDLMNRHGGEAIKIIAKIENSEGIENIDEIIHAADGIMIARGDMGVEVPLEDLPHLQKMLIKKVYSAGKMVITATQMLESMISHPRPTRAEVSDVANAVYDGTSAVMLSGETAAGAYPVKTVATMVRIVNSTENDIDFKKRFDNSQMLESTNVTNAISHATCTTAYDLRAAAIITVTMSGRTARNISKYRPDIPIIASTTSEQTYHQLALSWGVVPIRIGMQGTVDELFNVSVETVRQMGYVQSGDLVVITTGVPLGIVGTTNLLKVHIAGDVLVTGTGINHRSWSGRLCVATSDQQALKDFTPGDILVVKKTSNDLMPILRKASGIVCEEGGMQSHAAIVGLSLEIPVLVGADAATSILTSGTHVTLDAERGVVCSDSSRIDSKESL